ncbi:MAG: AsmA family protein [Desulfobulbaceae bacterium]|nr:AsmA family protein [Desulfobulbaceae bacterium]
MKKLILFLVILCTLGLLIYHGPRLLDLRPVRAQVAARVSTATGWQVEANRLHWDWFPVPHFSLNDISMSKGGITIAVPETRIYPRLLPMLHGQFDLGELKLVKPQITVAAWPPESSEAQLTLPHLNLTIAEGTALVTGGPFGKDSAHPPLLISGINSRLRLTPERCDLKITCASPLFSELEVRGNYNTADQGYQFDYEVTGLELDHLTPDLLAGRLQPKLSGLALQGNITGQGMERYRLEVAGDFPDFLLPQAPKKPTLDCGEFSCTIDKNPQTLSIAIAKLQLKNPKAILSGRIAVSEEIKPPAATPKTQTTPVKTWLIDLNGRDLDLTGIRQRIIDLFGDHHVTQLVCDIVRGGAANSASYYFRGGVADFEYLEKMTIKVDVDRSEIHPPGTQLDLREVGGPIEISKGYLSGQGLHAKLGNSTGNNCALYLDLLERKNEFKLDLDIQADLLDLPKVLLEEVKHPRFQEEVRHFKQCRGQAQGHLTIGNSLLDPQVTVLVNSMEGTGEYDRVSWPFKIKSGTLAVFPDRVTWRDLKGSWGTQQIQNTSGQVEWHGPIEITGAALSASLDLAPLLKEVIRYPAVAEQLHPALTSAEGTLGLQQGEFSGLLDTPESWRYGGHLTSNGSRWNSPLLPQPFLAEELRATINQEKVDLGESRFRFLDQPLSIEGNFHHQRFAEWRGRVSFTGTVKEKLAEWIKGKNWIPSEYFPLIPCTLDRLRIDWDKESTAITGAVRAGTGTAEAPEIRLNLLDTSEFFTVKELVIAAPPDHGKLQLQYPKKSPAHLSLGWQGFVEADSISKLLATNIIHGRRLEGDFTLQLPLRPGGKNLRGWFKTMGMQWPLGDIHNPTVLRDLSLRSQEDGSLVIEKALLDSGASKGIEINGTVTPAVKQLDFKLNLNADKLTRDTVAKLSEGIGKLSGSGPEGAVGTPTQDETKEWPRRGTLQFRIERFESTSAGNTPTGATAAAIGDTYSLSPARGFLSMLPSGGYSLDLRSSKVCGLDISGTIFGNPGDGETALNFFTDSAAPPQLQEVIPCFGFGNTLIEGPLHLDGNLLGSSQHWRDGKISLYSENGFIRRLGFLAKIFSVINLTDLFTSQPLPQLGGDGFAYSSLEIESHIENNRLIIEKAVIKGKGLNLFGSGKIDLKTGQADLIIMVAPLKSIDAIITNLPLIGQVVGGKDKALLSIPVGLKGDLRDPEVTLLPPEAIGEGIVNLFVNTFKMPLTIFSPLTNLGH